MSNLLLTLPETKLQSPVSLEDTNNVQLYFNSILDTGTNETVIVFMEQPAQLNPGSTTYGVIIKKKSLK